MSWFLLLELTVTQRAGFLNTSFAFPVGQRYRSPSYMAIISVLHGGAAGQLDYVKGTNRAPRSDDEDEDAPQTGNSTAANKTSFRDGRTLSIQMQLCGVAPLQTCELLRKRRRAIGSNSCGPARSERLVALLMLDMPALAHFLVCSPVLFPARRIERAATNNARR